METREFLDQSIALMASEEMRKFWVCIREAAGFHLSSAECEPFLASIRYRTGAAIHHGMESGSEEGAVVSTSGEWRRER